MSTLERDDQPPVTLCEACCKPAECGLWEHAVCYVCASDWREKAPEAGALESRANKLLTHQELGVEYVKFTTEWLTLRRAALGVTK